MFGLLQTPKHLVINMTFFIFVSIIVIHLLIYSIPPIFGSFLDKNNQLAITDVEQAKIFTIATLDQPYELLDWSSNNQQILLRTGTKYFSFDIDQKELKAIPIVGIQKMIWENTIEVHITHSIESIWQTTT